MKKLELNTENSVLAGKLINFIKHINSSMFKFKEINLNKGDAIYIMPGCKMKKRELDKILKENYPGTFRAKDISKATKILMPNYISRESVDSRTSYFTYAIGYTENGIPVNSYDIRKKIFNKNSQVLSSLGIWSYDLKLKKLVDGGHIKKHYHFYSKYAKLENQLQFLYKIRHKVYHENSVRRITVNFTESQKEKFESSSVEALIQMLSTDQEDNVMIALEILKGLDYRKSLYKIISIYYSSSISNDTRKVIYSSIFFKFPDLQKFIPKPGTYGIYYSNKPKPSSLKKLLNFLVSNQVEFSYKEIIEDFFELDLEETPNNDNEFINIADYKNDNNFLNQQSSLTVLHHYLKSKNEEINYELFCNALIKLS